MTMTYLRGFIAVSVAAIAMPARANITNGVDPSYVRVKVFEIRLFTDANCTGQGTRIYSNASPSYQDWANGPTLGEGAIPNGSYSCMAMKMSDQIHYTPATSNGGWTHGVCTPGTDYTLDVAHDDTAIDPDGTQHAVTKGVEDIVWLYVRTAATNSNNGDQHTWQPTGGIRMVAPLEVSGDQSRTVVFDFSNLVGEEFDTVWQCGCDAPTISFR